MNNYFQRLKNRVLQQRGQDHYHALGYYLTKSKSARYFAPEENEPSRHSWVENMRFLLRELGFDKLIRFLDWCVANHKHPWRGHIKAFLARKVQAVKAVVCACCCQAKTLIHTMCRECSSLSETQRDKIKQEIVLWKKGASLSAFARWNKLTKRFIMMAKKALSPIGQLSGQYKAYDVYDKWELRSLMGELQQLDWDIKDEIR